MSSLRSGAATCLLGLALLAAPGASTAGPLVMGPLYAEPTRPSSEPAPPGAGGCPVEVIELTDSRRAPETMGSILTFNAIRSPADRQAWLRSVVEVGLTARGFHPSFPEQAAPGAVAARIRLRSVWISLLQMNKTGSGVLQASAGVGSADGPMKVYRGDKTSVNMWGSQSEFNGLVNQVMAEALDGLAEDLRPLCTAAPPTTP